MLPLDGGGLVALSSSTAEMRCDGLDDFCDCCSNFRLKSNIGVGFVKAVNMQIELMKHIFIEMDKIQMLPIGDRTGAATCLCCWATCKPRDISGVTLRLKAAVTSEFLRTNRWRCEYVAGESSDALDDGRLWLVDQPMPAPRVGPTESATLDVNDISSEHEDSDGVGEEALVAPLNGPEWKPASPSDELDELLPFWFTDGVVFVLLLNSRNPPSSGLSLRPLGGAGSQRAYGPRSSDLKRAGSEL